MQIFSRLRRYFFGGDHKRMMLNGLLASSVVLVSMLALMAAVTGFWDIAVQKGVLALFLAFLFAFCRKRRDSVPQCAAVFLAAVEIDASTAIFGPHFYDFVTVYPFFPMLGFFFFYSLRTALWLSVLHLLYWSVFAYYGLHAFVSHPLFREVPLVNMFSSSLVTLFIGIFYNVSTEMTYEKLEKADRQKTLLLREIHHRIKNNLNRIASIFGIQILQQRRIGDDGAVALLEENRLRVESMALVHETLYRSDDFESIDADDYLRRLVALVGDVYGKELSLSFDLSGTFDLDTMMRLGMIVNELYTNSLKYAPETSQVRMGLSCTGNDCIFTCFQSSEPLDPDTFKGGIGLKLVRLLAEEMDGTLEISGEKGLSVTLRFESPVQR